MAYQSTEPKPKSKTSSYLRAESQPYLPPLGMEDWLALLLRAMTGGMGVQEEPRLPSVGPSRIQRDPWQMYRAGERHP